jgi:hypothetical protein
MGLRGPKPKTDAERRAALSQLRTEAELWATFFYALRDGQNGMVYVSEWGRWANEPGLGHVRRGRVLGAEIIPSDRRSAERIISEIKKAGSDRFLVEHPITPAPYIWKQLETASTASAVKRAARAVRAWAAPLLRRWGVEWQTTIENWVPQHFSGAIFRHAQTIVDAKKLPNYPGDPSSNDDKRIVFFAKIMAGLTLGLAPLTATKRLSHWRIPRGRVDLLSRAFAVRHPLQKRRNA